MMFSVFEIEGLRENNRLEAKTANKGLPRIPDAVAVLQEELGWPVKYIPIKDRERVEVLVLKTDDKRTINSETDDKRTINSETDDKRTINIHKEDKLLAIIRFLSDNGPSKTDDIAKELSLSVSQVKRYLYRLVGKGFIEANGANRNRTYVLCKNRQ